MLEMNNKGKEEGTLHNIFKQKMYKILYEYLQKSIPFYFYPPLSLNSQINLLENICKIQMEKNLDGICRPDISLIDTKGDVLVAIEIVDTHTPKNNVIQYYREHNIALYQINIRSYENLNNIETKSKTPNIWTKDYYYNEVGCKLFFEHVKRMREIQKSIKDKLSFHYSEKNKPLEKIVDEELKLIEKSSIDDYLQGIKGYGSYRDNQFIAAVREMRYEQKKYINTYLPKSRRLSYKWEKCVDRLINQFLDKIHPQPIQLHLEL